MNRLFGDQETVCVHTVRSFEETLLAAMINDVGDRQVDLRMATLSAPNFASTILGIQELDDAEPEWQDFLRETNAVVKFADMDSDQPAVAFLNERYELFQSIEDLKKNGNIPVGFERIIDSHFQDTPVGKNEIVLNRKHRLVKATLKNSPRHPLASVLRIVVTNALSAAGAAIGKSLQEQQQDDLTWIAEALGQSGD